MQQELRGAAAVAGRVGDKRARIRFNGFFDVIGHGRRRLRCNLGSDPPRGGVPRLRHHGHVLVIANGEARKIGGARTDRSDDPRRRRVIFGKAAERRADAGLDYLGGLFFHESLLLGSAASRLTGRAPLLRW